MNEPFPHNFVHVKDLYRSIESSIDALKSDNQRVRKARKIVEHALSKGTPHYGINTGFGALATKRVSDSQLAQLQRNLVLSHAVGVGNLVPMKISKLILQLKIHSLGLGYSGVSPETFNRLLYFLQEDLIPVIPEKGSVGASGDLAPLAHMSLPIIG